MRFAIALAPLVLAACVTEQGPPPRLDPSTPMTTRTLNTSLDCSQWERNSDGSWTAKTEVTIASPNGPAPIAKGDTFREGTYTMGVDVAYGLKRECAH